LGKLRNGFEPAEAWCASADGKIPRLYLRYALPSFDRARGLPGSTAVPVVMIRGTLRPRPYRIGIRLRIDVGPAADDTAVFQLAVRAVLQRPCASVFLGIDDPHAADAAIAVVGAAPSGPCGRAVRSRKDQNCRQHESLLVHRCFPTCAASPS